MIKLTCPVNPEILTTLRAGDRVLISGTLYTARDAAHKRFCDLLKIGEPLPVNLKNSAIYYVGPTPAKPGMVIGSAGPTSSYRMDPYAVPLLKEGVKVMIGKGPRSNEYKALLKKYGAVYLSAIGGTAALISQTVKKCEVVAYADLGAEAVHRLEVEDFYAIVTYDALGNDLYARQ